ncbi:hypothetical protein [Neobacillus mesonae]|uniref:hypothetical protein n=1 Tax=Neobacillus mesonae TaxID=1193713 RepID=UPI00203C6030|nr:hypothetical protein [Neobacillus mesonae]MCM3567005.1 hypothetical protein [Neobacillus mesonae]
MKLADLQNEDFLQRPEGNKRTTDDGTYDGITSHAEFQEWSCNFSKDGSRVVLCVRIEVEDSEGEPVDLYIAPNYSWSKKGKMVKLLEDLDMLPAPGQGIKLADFVGIPVQVTVENVEKDDETYSNITRIKRTGPKKESSGTKSEKRVAKKRPIPKRTNGKATEALFSNSQEDEYEEVDSIEDMD